MDVVGRWRQHRRSAAFHRAPAFDERGLMLGCGTILLPFTRGLPAGLVDSNAHDRLLALLAVAAGGRLTRSAILTAIRWWVGGDRVLAAIRLAFAPLPRGRRGCPPALPRRGRPRCRADAAGAARGARLRRPRLALKGLSHPASRAAGERPRQRAMD